METNPDGKRLQEDLFCDSGCITAADFKNKLSQEYPVFVKHKALVTNQYAMVHGIKDNLNEETHTVQMDFVEKFRFNPW